MKFKLRWYQAEAVDAIFDYFIKGNKGNPLVLIPTAGGKSVIIAEFIKRVHTYWNGQRVICATHRKELVGQNAEKMMVMHPSGRVGIYSAGLGRKDTVQPTIFAGIDSIVNRAHEFGHINLLIVDECHLMDDKDGSRYMKFILGLMTKNPNLRIIGFTATPWREGLGHLINGKIFTDVAYDLISREQINRLIDEGFLSNLISKATTTKIDLSGVHKRGGEYIESEVQAASDKEEITRAAIAEAIAKGGDRKHWMIFATGVKHAENIGAILAEHGISYGITHSKNGKAGEQAIKDFLGKRITALINVGKLTTGFDAPFVDMLILLRPTASAVLHVQILGRGLRIYPGKIDCLVLDFAGNVKRLGPLNDPVIPPKKGEKAGIAPVRECNGVECAACGKPNAIDAESCEHCGTYKPQGEYCGVLNHASARQCFHCGFVFPRNEGKHLSGTADEVDIIARGEEPPIIEIFKVQGVTFSQHKKKDRPTSMKVSYTCGAQFFNEFVCLEHEGGAKAMAARWWRLRSSDPVPSTVALALEKADTLKMSTHIKVIMPRRAGGYPTIKEHDLTGGGFGTEALDLMNDTPVIRPSISIEANEDTAVLYEDDISF